MSHHSMIERKCPNCGTWNKDEDFCINCQTAISPKEIDKIETEIKRLEEINRPKDKFDILAEDLKNHKYFVGRLIYKIGRLVGLFFGVLGGFLAWVIAMLNG